MAALGPYSCRPSPPESLREAHSGVLEKGRRPPGAPEGSLRSGLVPPLLVLLPLLFAAGGEGGAPARPAAEPAAAPRASGARPIAGPPSPSDLLPAGGSEGTPAFPFEEGEHVPFERLRDLRPFLPPQVWAHRSLFFYEGMDLEIGPPHRDYGPPGAYREATARFRGRARVGPKGELLDYVAGQPFPVDEVACSADPDAGSKLIWDFVHRWQGFGVESHFRYVYLDRGEVLPLRYAGTTFGWLLKHRPEPQYLPQGGDVFPGEQRAAVVGFEVEEPESARGTRTLTYRYEDSFAPPPRFRPEDTWIYLRDLRRIRKISETQRSIAVAGTDFSFDDLFSFSGLPWQYEWRCVGERDVLAPMNTRRLGYPYVDLTDFGPSGLALASDRFELRRAIVLEMRPRDPDHPYQRKEIWLDRQTLQPLYSFAYDRTGALWKIIQHLHRWSEDELAGIAPRDWYPGWESVPEPRDLRVVVDAVANVQTGTGNRIEFWDAHGTPPPVGRLRRMIDVRRLRRGR